MTAGSKDVRVRFAPSPTGALHVGSARTALLNWLFARHSGGTLILRIDDTDAERSDATLEQAILDDLAWLGIDHDEGPLRQSERSERYAEALKELPVEQVDGAWQLGGRVIARADGSPLYHLATAVDDIDFEITHVLRGRDHLPNTELQQTIIRALGAEPPHYVHAPLLVFPDGAKLSKREGEDEDEAGELTVAALRDQGYLPAALCNALALSLTDFGTDELMLSALEMAERFELERLHTADAQFDLKKLRWLSGQHIRALDAAELERELAARGVTEAAAVWGFESIPEAAVEAARTAGETLEECAEAARELLDPPPPDKQAIDAIHDNEVGIAWAVLDELIEQWPPSLQQAEEVFAELKDEITTGGYDLGVCLRGIRAVLTARTEGPEYPLMLACITQARWDNAGYEGA